jgi:hypothetical protein
MKVMAGAGALRCGARQVPVAYGLVERPGDGRFSAEGDVFGDPQALVELYNQGPCDLLLETGGVARAVLTVCHLHGAAEVRIAGPIAWR